MTYTDAELTWGDLDLLSEPFHALAGFSTGAPEHLVTALPRLLLDGELVTHDRDSNRELPFRLEVSGDDVLALNEAEALLVRQANRPRSTLRWKPPGVSTPVTVFDTFAGFVAQVFDEDSDLQEMRGKRVYSVTIPALPHARSETLRSASLAGRSATTLLDACDSLTNWGAGGVGWATPTLDTSVKFAGTGSLKATGTHNVFGSGSGGGDALGFKRTASFSAAAGTHVVAVLLGSSPMASQPLLSYTATGGPVVATSLVSAVAQSGGWVEYTWALNNDGPLTVTSLTWQANPSTPSEPGAYTITAWLDNVQTFTAAPPVDKGGLRLLETGGSVRTPGTLRLSNASTALGSVLVATWPDLGDGYRPDAGRWYKSGGTRSSDSTSVSGYTFTDGAQFEVPNQTLAPGPYAVFVATASAAGKVTVTAQTKVGTTLVGPTPSASGNVTAGAIAALGIIHLPASASATQSTAVTRLTVAIAATTGSTVQEVWLVRIDDAQVTWLDSLTTKRVWLESPSADQPYGGVWVGDNADQSDARHPADKLKMLGRHIFESPTAAVYVAATGAAPSLDLLHYETWHSNAAS